MLSHLLFPRGRKLLSALVVTGKAMDTRLDKNKTEFGVRIFAVFFQMLSDRDGFFDQVIQILGNFGRQTLTETTFVIDKTEGLRIKTIIKQ